MKISLIALSIFLGIWVSTLSAANNDGAQLITADMVDEVPDKDFILDVKDTYHLSCSTEDEVIDGVNSGVPDESLRWRNGITFKYDQEFSQAEKDAFTGSLFALSKVVTCIPFRLIPDNVEPRGDYVFVRKGVPGSGCKAHIGRQGGHQEMNLESPGCIRHSIFTHETIHALGFLHEHARPDRDNFVDIFPANIIEGEEHNFKKFSTLLTFGVHYDVNSIMHYASEAFAKDSSQPTILKKDGSRIPYNSQLRDSDKLKLQRMYNC